MTLGIGDEAPDFTLQDQHDATVKLSRLRGKPVVVYPNSGEAWDAVEPWAYKRRLTREDDSVTGVEEHPDTVDALRRRVVDPLTYVLPEVIPD